MMPNKKIGLLLENGQSSFVPTDFFCQVYQFFALYLAKVEIYTFVASSVMSLLNNFIHNIILILSLFVYYLFTSDLTDITYILIAYKYSKS